MLCVQERFELEREKHLHALQMCRGVRQKILHCLSRRTDLESFWFMILGWEERAEKLFTLAGEVEEKSST
jgi:hypothetical protein